jgi:hypothetical protein
MKTEIRKFVIVVSTLGLLVVVAQGRAVEVENDNTSVATQNTRTSSDHDSIAKQYENKAKELLVKAEERKRLLQHYEDNSYLYGRGGQDFQSQAIALERKYKQAAEKATSLATLHYKMAFDVVKRDYAASPQTPEQLSSR